MREGLRQPAAPSAKEASSILKFLNRASDHRDIMFALGIVAILAVLLVPVPTMLLDLLLGISITFSVLVLMTVLFISRPLDFSSFPTILLIAAMFRLSLNIASTRLILSEGHTGRDAAGHVIEAFGDFVMAGSVVIGAIVFGILTVINFVVITKGSGRVAEVGARFTLDAMPGKQMAIDADLSAGLINEEEARVRRKDLENESSFYGAMDGASKFVRGDAVAGLLVTFINFIGGIVIGMVQKDMGFADALETYTALTIGDGLVSQIPSIIVSTAAGLLVTKAGAIGSADKAVFEQLGRHPQALGMASALILGMGFMPGMPLIPFAFLASATGGLGYYIYKNAAKPKEEYDELSVESKGKSSSSSQPRPSSGGGGGVSAQAEEEPVSKTLQIDSIRLELGYGLLPLINYEKGNRLPDQVKALRKQLARDMGFIMPSVRIQDNMQLNSNEYVIRVKEIESARGEVRPEMLLVMDPTGGKISLNGEDTREPAFGLPAKWIAESSREEALFRNYTIVDPPTVITTHLTEVIKENITDLLSYGETKKLLDNISEDHRKLVEDLVPSKLPIGVVQRVLQNLLSESVSIRDLPTIMESLAEIGASTNNITLLTEHVRSRLARQISNGYLNDQGYLPILSLSPTWEQLFQEGLVGNDEKQLSIPPSKLQEFITAVKRSYEQFAMKGENPILLTSPHIRPYVRSITERFRPATVVLSQSEIHPKVKIKTIGQL